MQEPDTKNGLKSTAPRITLPLWLAACLPHCLPDDQGLCPIFWRNTRQLGQSVYRSDTKRCELRSFVPSYQGIRVMRLHILASLSILLQAEILGMENRHILCLCLRSSVFFYITMYMYTWTNRSLKQFPKKISSQWIIICIMDTHAMLYNWCTLQVA